MKEHVPVRTPIKSCEENDKKEDKSKLMFERSSKGDLRFIANGRIAIIAAVVIIAIMLLI